MRRNAITALAAVLLGTLAVAVSGCGGDDDSTTTTATTTASPSELGLTAESCRYLINLPVTFTDAVTGLASDLDETVVVLRTFARGGKAPPQLRTDFRVLAAAGTKIATTLKGVDRTVKAPSPATIAKLRRLSRQVNTEAVTGASASISTWAQANCPRR